VKSLRLPRLARALQTLALAGIRTVARPNWTRDFLAYVYTYRPLPYSSRIRRVALADVLEGIGQIPLTLRKCFPRHGNMTGEEIMTVVLLVRWFQPGGIFEFGTFDGNTTLQMTLNAPPACRIATLNLPPDHGETQLVSSEQDKLVHPARAGSGGIFHGEPEKARIDELFGDSASFDFGPFLGRFDFVLVDAGHEYDYVRSDTENAFQLLPPSGGIVVWHDFPNAPGVCRWLEELAERETIYHVANTRLAFALRGARGRSAGNGRLAGAVVPGA
jgi:hypothetical protein